MIRNIPHQVERVLEDGTLECDCGAVWRVTDDAAELLEGNTLCDLPTLADRWLEVVKRLRTLARIAKS